MIECICLLPPLVNRPTACAALFFHPTHVSRVALFCLRVALWGPDFTAPQAPDVTAYDSTTVLAQTTDGAQYLHMGAGYSLSVVGLVSLRRSQPANRAIDQRKSRSRHGRGIIARGRRQFGRGKYRIVSDGERQLLRPAAKKRRELLMAVFVPGFTYSLYNASVGVTYALDVFGGTRRAIEQSQALADQARFEREAAYLTLTSNVVTAAIQEASLREQLESTHEIISEEEKVLKILQARFDSGAASKSTVLEQQSTLAVAKTNLPPLEHQLAVTRHLLSVLAGQFPFDDPSVKFTLDRMVLPMHVPLSIPSKLVEQRPDVREAEEKFTCSQCGHRRCGGGTIAPDHAIGRYGVGCNETRSIIFARRWLLGLGRQRSRNYL